MTVPLQSVQILGVHPVVPSTELFEETLDLQWGSDLTGDNLRQAEEDVRDHFNGLFLIEIQIDPPDATIEWGDFAQQVQGKPQSDWQVAYDECAIDEAAGVWAFFLHYVNLEKPLETPIGPKTLPNPSPRPSHLSDCDYHVP